LGALGVLVTVLQLHMVVMQGWANYGPWGSSGRRGHFVRPAWQRIVHRYSSTSIFRVC